MSSDPTSTLEKLRHIKQRFADSLPDRQDEIEASFQSLQGHWSEEVLSTLHRHIHTLKGSAATFGFENISQQASYIEQNLGLFNDQKPAELDILDLHANLATLYSLMHSPVASNASETNATQGIVGKSIKILLAEDDENIRDQLIVILEAQGHIVIPATNGIEALDLFHQHQPDLVIMDVIMPKMDGYTATRKIKQACGNHFIPVIFLTALSNDDELVRCVESGGDDFLIKPVNSELLNARIFAMQRIKLLHKELEEYKSRTEIELELGRSIFQNIINRNPKDIPFVHYWLNPAGHFSGDMISFQKYKDDDIYLLIGDFTGHGLAAATGAIPASDIFYTLAPEGLALAEMAATLNNKLNTLLPTGNFFACCLLRYQPGRQQLQILNCGLPPVYLITQDSSLRSIKSAHLSMGIMPETDYHDAITTLDSSQFCQLLAYTDGVTELQNDAGEMLGQTMLEQMLLKYAAIDNKHLIQHLRSELHRYQSEGQQADDITLLHLQLDKISP